MVTIGAGSSTTFVWLLDVFGVLPSLSTIRIGG